MASSSNIAGDIKQGLRLRKVNAKYFSFKWRDCGESGIEKNSGKYKSNECTSDNSNDDKNPNGFFKNIKKKLSIKNLYKSKRKIIATESSNELEEGSCSLTTDSSERQNSSSFDKHKDEIKGPTKAPDPDNSTAESCDSTQSSRHETNESLLNYLHFQTNVNNSSSGNTDNFDNLLVNSNNDVDNHAESFIKEQSSILTENYNDLVNFSTENSCTERLNFTDEPPILPRKTEAHGLSQELDKLSKYGWYWGSISGDEADAKLISEPDGAFLIRDSSDHRYLLTLSFKSAGKLLHARVEHSGGMFSLCSQGEIGKFTSVPALIDHSMNSSKSAVFCYSRPLHPGYPAFPVRLTKPVSRFSQVRSLQYLCRFVIRQHMRRDNICKLPLPESLKEYVEEGPYY